MTTLFGGPNQIGSVTVSNFTAPNVGNVTLNPSSAHIGSVSLFGDIPVTMSSISLYGSESNIGSVSVLGGQITANAGTNLNTSALALESGGNLDAIAASLDTLDSVDYMLGSDFVAPNLGNVTLNPSSAHVGSVSIFGSINLGQVTLFPSPNQIGSVTVSNFTAPNTGSVTLNSSQSNIGSVSVLGGTIVANAGTNLNTSALALESGGNLDAIAASLDTLDSIDYFLGSDFVAPNLGNVTINPGPNQIGSVTVSNFVAPNTGNVTLNASSANIGSVSVLGGQITANAGTNLNTSALALESGGNLAAIAASLDTLDSVDYMLGSDFVAPNLGNVTLNRSPNFIGLVTTYPGRSLTTSMATIYSGAGNYTLFVPPTGQKFFVHNLMVNAQGVSDGHIKAGTNPKWPWAGLATYGGFAKTFTDPGLAMGAVNEAFVVTLNSAATISIDVGVHFEA